MGRNKLVILWVEDDPNDVALLRRAFKKAGISPVHICHDGDDAVRYIRGEPPYDDRQIFPAPTLVITDIKMPKKSGLELLRWLRTHPNCGGVPMVVFSASAQATDIQDAYQLGAAGFFQKPNTLDKMIEVVGRMLTYWNDAFPPEPPTKCG
jgi:CheY-like chemotaxis protein